MKNIIAGIGELLWDMLPDGKKIGGAPANFAYHVSQFGLDSCVVSAVGHDPLGEEIIDILTRKGLNFIIERVDRPTGTVLIELDAQGVPVYDITRHVAWDHIPFTPSILELALNSRAICYGSLAQRGDMSRQTINRFMDLMPEHALKICDINLRQNFYTREVLESSMYRCNILKINDEELETITPLLSLPPLDMQEKCRHLLEAYNLKILILTCGVNGSYVFTPSLTNFLPTPKIEVVDTVGAGDSFTAAFIASLLQGKSIESAHERAVEVSAYVCTQHGAMPRLPERLTR